MVIKRPPIAVLIAAHVKAQPRKAAVLGILFVIMVGIYVRMYWSTYGPRMAEAHQPTPSGAVTEFAVRGDQSPPRRVTIHVPAQPELRRDPFRLDLSRYPVHRIDDEPDHRITVTRPDADAIRAEVERLSLQSILWQEDGTALACIGGRMVQQGDRIEGFRVEKVEPTRVLLEREGLRLALTLR